MALNISKNEYPKIVEKVTVRGDLAIIIFDSISTSEADGAELYLTIDAFEDAPQIEDFSILTSNPSILLIDKFETIITNSSNSFVIQDLLIFVKDVASTFLGTLLWDNWTTPWDSCLTSWDNLIDPTPQEEVIMVWDLMIRLWANGTVVENTCDIANFDGAQSLTGARPMISQSFQTNGGLLNSASFNLSKKGTITGLLRAEIYDVTGTFGVSNVPTGPSLALSETIDTSILTTQYDGTVGSLLEVFFDFTPANLMLVSGNYYCVVIHYLP